MIKNFHFGLVGQNIAYSKSVDIFNAIFEIKKIDGKCSLFDIDEADFDSKFKELLNGDVNGLSVTIPYKSKVIPFLDEIYPTAEAMNAVNSIYISKEKSWGDNTDCFGFSLPLAKYAEKLKHSNAVIMGNGGAAKAVIYSLYTDYELSNYILIGRDIEKLEEFKKSLLKVLPELSLGYTTFDRFSKLPFDNYSILINTTPLGGWNHKDNNPIPDLLNLSPNRIYYDLNYNFGNKIIEMAKSKDMITIDGSRMLVGQALRSFYLWTGEKVEFNLVYKKVFGDSNG